MVRISNSQQHNKMYNRTVGIKTNKIKLITCQATCVAIITKAISHWPDRNYSNANRNFKRHVNVVLDKQRKNKSVDIQRNKTRASPPTATR